MPKAPGAVFPATTLQTRIVHLIRHSLDYASLKDRKLLAGMARLMDLNAFRQRVEVVAAAGASPEVQEFLEAWRRADRGDRD